jgi:hypothetical protein
MGDPGSGKSSLVKRIFRDTCLLGIKKPRQIKLPILIELKNITHPDNLDKAPGEWLYLYIKNEVAKNNIYKMDECIENYAATKGILILFDGLDEVSSANYVFIEKCINGLSHYLNELSPNNTVVLTMRTQFYQQIKSDFYVNFPHSTFLKPFTPSDIFEFLSKWHFSKEAEKNISRIYKDLTDRPTLREMCSNPLILSMYVAEDQISGGNVSPESRTQFYRKVTEELIIKRRIKQKSSMAVSYSTLKEQRERILGEIAYQHLIDIDQPKNTLNWRSAILSIKRILDCDDERAETIFNEISKETGLISEERNRETFRFIHLTFCEFLAAFEVAQGIENGWNELMERHRNFANTSTEGRSRLIEVVPFATGLLPRIKRVQALSDVSQLNDLTLMSRCFLETKLYEHESWSAFIRSAKENIIIHNEEKFEEKWLLDLHIFNVVVRDANLAAENLNINQTIDLSDFYEQLLDNQKDSLNKILSSFATHDAAAVFRLCEICHINLREDFPLVVIENCDQIPFLGLIKDKIVQGNSESHEWAALLSESALKKRLVSTLLNSTPKSDKLSAKLSRRDNYRIWHYKDYIPETFLTQCFSLATSHNVNLRCTTRLLLLKALKSPFERRAQIILMRYFYAQALILFFTLSVVYPAFFSHVPREWSSFEFWLQRILISLPLVGFLFYLRARHRLRYTYDVAYNLEPIKDDILSSFDRIIELKLLSTWPFKSPETKTEVILNKLKESRGG